jgi:hypothetical protein
MELLGDVGNVDSHFHLFGDSVGVGARYVHDFRHCTIGLEIFWIHPMVLQGDEALVETRFGPFGDSANPNAR